MTSGWQVNSIVHRPDQAVKRNRFFHYTHKTTNCFVLLLVAVLCALLLPAFASRALAASAPESETLPSILDGATLREGATSDAADDKKLFIRSWQGAKSYGDRFSITVDGPAGSAVRFTCKNCAVSPAEGTVGDTFVVTLGSAGEYSVTVSSDSAMHDVKTGFAGKADQASLVVDGWRGARDYYHVFDISVTGGSTNGRVRFETKGCTVTPAEGTTATKYTVTVTSVGSYELTAIMDGDVNHSEAYSMTRCGSANKANQSPVSIDGWESEARCGDAFEIRVSGGSTKESLIVEAVGCKLTKTGTNTYEVNVTSVGPYAVSATRAGNYGYYPAAASVCGVSYQADQPGLSIKGWAENRNCGDAFQIIVTGGASGATVRFAASGCTVSPASGEAGEPFTVHVSSVGDYSLTAYADESETYAASNSRTYKGVAGKGTQLALSIKNWNENASSDGTFEVKIGGGSGTGGVSVTTQGGCTAMPKNGENGVYIVTVTGSVGQQYGLSVGKASDASYHAAVPKTVYGTISAAQEPIVLNVSGWNDTSTSGESFSISLSGGTESCLVTFDPTGCTVSPASGTLAEEYTVTVTAKPGEPYSLTINRASEASHGRTSVLRSGNVLTAPSIKREQNIGSDAASHDDELYTLTLVGMGLLIAIVAVLAILVRKRQSE